MAENRSRAETSRSEPTQVPVPRKSHSTLRLLRDAIGGPAEIRGKLHRTFRTARILFDQGELDRRLDALGARGLAPVRPSRVQLLFGGLDMLRFMIEPAAREYYEQQGIRFGLHQLLRVLDDPMSMLDPTGIFSDLDTIIGHVMQVVHLNPVYDLQLMAMFPEGLAELRNQAEAMVQGHHPRQRTIGAIVEDAGYHARLLDYVDRFARDPQAEPPIRPQPKLRQDRHFTAAEATFASLPTFLEYSVKLPNDLGALISRMRSVRRFPLDLSATPATTFS